MDEITELDDKYLVLKYEDISNGLDAENAKLFRDLIQKVDAYRRLAKEKPVNKYVVLNLADKIDITKLGLELCVKEHTPQKVEGNYNHRFLRVGDIATDIVNSIIFAENQD